MPQTTASDHPFIAGLAELENSLAARGPKWLRELRRAGRARFDAVGLPHTRLEEWRATNVTPIARTRFGPGLRTADPLPAALPGAALLELGGSRLVFVDGRYRPELSSDHGSDGVWTGSLTEAIEARGEHVRTLLTGRDPETDGAFAAINTAFLEDGAVVMVPDGVQVDKPIELVFVSTGHGGPSASQPRTLIHVGAAGDARIVETYIGLGDETYWTNSVTDVVLGDGARLERCKRQLEGAGAFHISTTESRQGRDSRYTCHTIDLGGRLVRHDATAVLDGEGGNCLLNGLYLTGGSQHVDNHTTLDHAKPHCDSRELYKGILFGKSRTVFNGRIIVREDAQKTDAKQSNPNLVLSEGAQAHTRPQLEIYADDVKCTHGATVGCLDEDAIFYLRSRAIPYEQARNVLIHAFADEVLQQISIEPARDRLQQAVASRLDSRATRTPA